MEALKNKYINLKKSCKKKFADEKKYSYGTGGGPPVEIKDSEIDEDLMEIMGSQGTGFVSNFDNDCMNFEGENITVLFKETENKEESEEISYSDDILGGKDWSRQTVENLRTPISKKLLPQNGSETKKRDTCSKTKLGNWAKSKQDVVSTQQQCLLEDHHQKLRHNEEIHQEKLKQMRESHECEIKFKEEECNLKLSILKLEKQKLLKELTQ